MTAAPDIVEQYLQADARVRAALFESFLQSLCQAEAGGGREQSRAWAARAVSPALDYSSMRRLRKHLARAADHVPSLRLAILGGPTTLQLVEMLEVCLAGTGIDAAFYQCEYGLFQQELLTPGSGLDQFMPHIVFLATSARDVTRTPSPSATREDARHAVEAEVEAWARLWHIAQTRWGAAVIQNTFDVSPWGVFGHFARRHAASREHWLQALNVEVAAVAPPFVVLHDLNLLVCELGAREWFDPRFYLEAKLPCGPECLVPYAHSVASIVAAMRGRARKVLVLDLDNTLWGGPVGDGGGSGIVVGRGSGEGEAYVAFQQHARALKDRGIVLAVCSKNDEAQAKEPFEQRADMVLRLADIACFVANWRDKAENLRDIATRLNLGVDSIVFVDDNPAERALVRRLLPEAAVPDMPDDPAGFIQALGLHRYFEMVSFTAEDARRADWYAQNAQREASASRAEDLDAFLASLGMVARAETVGSLNIDRVTQLVNKSNQFNLTTRRYTVAEVQALTVDPSWLTLAISLRDSLGDHGLISVILAHRNGSALDIDTWLMSCRVLQRGVEVLARDLLLKRAKEMGCDVVTGTYIRSPRNSLVCDHYARLGWTAAGADADSTRWQLSVDANTPGSSSHIRLEAGFDV